MVNRPGFCNCGCGQSTKVVRGRPNLYVIGHSTKGKMLSTRGRKASLETRRKQSKARMGKEPWNKGTTGQMPVPWNKGKTGLLSEETLHKMSLASKGHIPWDKGKKLSNEHRKKISESHKSKTSPKKGKHSGVVPWNKGKHNVYTKETKKLMDRTREEGKREWYERLALHKLSFAIDHPPKLCKCGCGEILFGKKDFRQGHRELLLKRETIECLCGCGRLIPSIRTDGKQRSYVIGHENIGKTHTKEWKTRQSYRMKENPPFKGKSHSLESREKMSRTRKGVPRTEKQNEHLLKMMRSGNKIENIVKNTLTKIGVDFEFQKPIFGSIVDFFNYRLRLIIEVNGCFWHGCPTCYDVNSLLSPLQYKRMGSEKALKSSAKEHGFEIFSIWEHEIKESEILVEKKLVDIIESRSYAISKVPLTMKSR